MQSEEIKRAAKDLLVLINQRDNSGEMFRYTFNYIVNSYEKDLLGGTIDAFDLYNDFNSNIPMFSNAALIVAIQNGYSLMDRRL